MVKANQITIKDKELPELKEWAEKENKKILKTIKLKNKDIRVIIGNN